MSVQGPNVAAMGATGGTQLSFADLAHAQGAAWTPADEMSLRETTFVVVDLETTGGRTTGNDATPPDAITEIGAVKVCGGAVLGEFATLVNPQHSIPPQIVRLTGITTAMVGNAPTIDAVLPMFFEFAGDSVLVAHNAGFDIGFLRAAARRCDITWPQPQVLCTMRLARRVLSRDEAPSVRLAALARLFAVASNPTHRALDDARATVDVLHALIERVGNQGVHTYAELRSYLPNVTQAQPARGSSDACGRRHPPRRSGDPAYAGTARRGTGGGDRAHRPLAGRAGSAHRRGLERRRRVGLPSALGRPVGSVGGNGALGPVGRRAAQQRLAVRSADRTAPIARATVRPHRCRLPHWPAATPPPRPAAIQHGWIIRRGRRSHRRR